MPLIFNQTTALFPFEVETVGIDWPQDPIKRPEGYHSYHLLEGQFGTGEIFLNDKKIRLQQGDLLLISPHLPHYYHRVGPSAWEINFLTFIGAGTKSLADFFHHADYIFIPGANSGAIRQIYEQLAAEQGSTQPTASSLLLYQLLHYLKLHVAVTAYSGHELTQEEQLRPVLAFIHSHLAQPITLAALAQQIYVSPQYLTRLFHKHLHTSPNDYVIQQRIQKAKGLLIENVAQSISQIGEQCGFNSASYFTKVFKETNQLTPKQFRELYKH